MRLEKGLVHVYTGEGRGKTSAAMNVAIRSAQRGYKVLIIQFIKEVTTSERAAFEQRFPEVEFHSMGEGFYKILNDRKSEEVHRKGAQHAFMVAKDKVMSGSFDVVVLDELNNALEYGFIKIKDVVQLIQERPTHVELIITGRSAVKEIIDLADYATEMKKIKHPFDKGVLARRGIDF